MQLTKINYSEGEMSSLMAHPLTSVIWFVKIIIQSINHQTKHPPNVNNLITPIYLENKLIYERILDAYILLF